MTRKRELLELVRDALAIIDGEFGSHPEWHEVEMCALAKHAWPLRGGA